MGFMDKAKAAAQDAAEKGKKAAAQAQEKLDDAQKNFNSGQAHSQQDTKAPAVEYDKHGRPIKGETIADAVDDPEPIAEVAPEDTGPPAGDPLADELPAPKAPSDSSGMSSGDPLAG